MVERKVMRLHVNTTTNILASLMAFFLKGRLQISFVGAICLASGLLSTPIALASACDSKVSQNKNLVIVELLVLEGDKYKRSLIRNGFLVNEHGSIITDHVIVQTISKIEKEKKEKIERKIIVHKNQDLINKYEDEAGANLGFYEKTQVENWENKEHAFSAELSKYNNSRGLLLLEIGNSHAKKLLQRGAASQSDAARPLTEIDLYKNFVESSNVLCVVGYVQDPTRKESIKDFKVEAQVGDFDAKSGNLFEVKFSSNQRIYSTQGGSLVYNSAGVIIGILRPGITVNGRVLQHAVPIGLYDSLMPELFIDDLAKKYRSMQEKYDKFSALEKFYREHHLLWYLEKTSYGEISCDFALRYKRRLVGEPYIKVIDVTATYSYEDDDDDDEKIRIMFESILRPTRHYCLDPFFHELADPYEVTFSVTPYVSWHTNVETNSNQISKAISAIKTLNNDRKLSDRRKRRESKKTVTDSIKSLEWGKISTVSFNPVSLADSQPVNLEMGVPLYAMEDR